MKLTTRKKKYNKIKSEDDEMRKIEEPKENLLVEGKRKEK